MDDARRDATLVTLSSGNGAIFYFLPKQGFVQWVQAALRTPVQVVIPPKMKQDFSHVTLGPALHL